MESCRPPSYSERRLKSKYYRSCSSSEALGEECVVCDDDVLAMVTIFGSSFLFDNVLKAQIDKMLLRRINKNADEYNNMFTSR